jgi:hypothetical protein
MTESYLLVWPFIAAFGTVAGVWLHSKVDPGVRPTRVPVAVPATAAVVRFVPRR